jgi:hypothetical protein
MATESYAKFRQRFTVGTVIEVDHERFAETANGRRVVVKVQKNAIVTQRPEDDPRGPIKGGSWHYWPPASHVTIDGDAARFAEPGYDGYTYRIVGTA